MIFLLLYRHRGAAPVVVTHGIGRVAHDLPGRAVLQAATRHTAVASARTSASLPSRRNTQGSTR